MCDFVAQAQAPRTASRSYSAAGTIPGDDVSSAQRQFRSIAIVPRGAAPGSYRSPIYRVQHGTSPRASSVVDAGDAPVPPASGVWAAPPPSVVSEAAGDDIASAAGDDFASAAGDDNDAVADEDDGGSSNDGQEGGPTTPWWLLESEDERRARKQVERVQRSFNKLNNKSERERMRQKGDSLLKQLRGETATTAASKKKEAWRPVARISTGHEDMRVGHIDGFKGDASSLQAYQDMKQRLESRMAAQRMKEERQERGLASLR